MTKLLNNITVGNWITIITIVVASSFNYAFLTARAEANTSQIIEAKKEIIIIKSDYARIINLLELQVTQNNRIINKQDRLEEEIKDLYKNFDLVKKK